MSEENIDEKTEQQIREELEQELAEKEREIEEAKREKVKQDELDKLEAKRTAPPKISNVKRSKLSYSQKREIISEYGIETYNNLDL